MSSFTFLTQNLETNTFDLDSRLGNFIENIKEKKPDVVVLQYVSRVALEKLTRIMGEIDYKRGLADIAQYKEINEVIFSKLPISDIKFCEFPRSTKKSGLTFLKIDVWGETPTWICTTEFDENFSFFQDQIKNLSKFLKTIPQTNNIILGCTTHLKSYQNFELGSGWIDAWYEAGKEDCKYTYDYTRNLLAKPPNKDRRDLVLFRSKDIVCDDFCFFSCDGLFSHYGILSTFVFEK